MAKRKKKDESPPQEMPPFHTFERAFRHMDEEPRVDILRSQAQELVYDAWEAPDQRTALRLAREAALLDPRCVDAHFIIAEAESRTDTEFVERLKRIVEIGAWDLGQEFFRKHRGHFWDMFESRPYMRVRAELAHTLMELGRVDEAIKHYEAMLILNPNDNQALRYFLLNCYLLADRPAGAGKLLRKYKGETKRSAILAWGLVLERFLSEDPEGLRQALQAARRINPHVERYLSGKRKMPRDVPDYYTPGKESEAIVCVDILAPAWRQHPTAVSWLKQLPKQ